MQKNAVRIVPAPWATSTPWCLVIPRFFTGIRRTKWFFGTREEAELYQARILTPPPIGGYVAAAKARANSSQPTEEAGTITVSQCARLWLDRFVSFKPTFFQNRQIILRFAKAYGRQPIATITAQDLDHWLRSLEPRYSPTTRHNYWRRVRQFFTWAHDFGYIPRNPMKVLKEPVRREKAHRAILRPEQMKACLELAKGDRVLTAYLCLGGFAGIRTSEILRMRWSDLFWDEGEIRVPVAKHVDTTETKDVWINGEDLREDISGDRMVTMEPALRRHLEPVEPVARVGEARIIPGGQRTLYLARTKLRTLLGVSEWPDNCLRHSYKSYHAAAFRNLELTRMEMGHSHSNTTKYKYGAARLKAVADAWWAL